MGIRLHSLTILGGTPGEVRLESENVSVLCGNKALIARANLRLPGERIQGIFFVQLLLSKGFWCKFGIKKIFLRNHA